MNEGNLQHSGATREGIDKAIAWMAQTGDRRFIPIFRAIRDFGVGFLSVGPETSIPDIPAKVRQRPLVMFVCDDVAASVGPDPLDGRPLRWLLRTAGAAMVCSSYPPDRWYALCATVAAAGRNVLIVDTTKDQEERWAVYCNRLLPADARLLIAADRTGPLAAANGDNPGLARDGTRATAFKF